MRANFAAFANALCHLNATPLSVAVLGLVLGAKMGSACGQSNQSENGGSVWAGDFSLSLSLSLLALFGTPLR